MSQSRTTRIATAQLNVRLTAAELAALQAHAACRGETVTALVRRALAETCERDRVRARFAEAREAFRGVVFVDVSEEG